MADDKGGKTTATVTYENGTPINIRFDYINEDGSSKYAQSAAGEYVMSETGLPWNEQADAIGGYLSDHNYDINSFELSDDEGHTDAITGVSIKIPDFIEAARLALSDN